MNFDQNSLNEKIDHLEQIELNNQDETKEEVYIKLMLFYILNDEAMKAKLLWKRIPRSLKDPSTELSKLWPIIQNFILCKYSTSFQQANQLTDFSNDQLRNLFNHFTEKMREKLFNLVQVAYSSVRVNELADLLQLDEEKIIKISLQSEWEIDETKNYLFPKKLPSNEVHQLNNQLQLEQLTKIVSFIET